MTYNRSTAPARCSTLPFITVRICMRMYSPMRKRIKLEFTVRLAGNRDAKGLHRPASDDELSTSYSRLSDRYHVKIFNRHVRIY